MTSQKVAGNAKIAIASRDRSVQLCTGLFINNEFVEGHGETIVSINPADQSTLAAVHSASVEDIDQAVKAARHAANTTWGTNTPATERAALMNKLADIMEARLEELAILETLDSGKGITWARGDITESISAFRYYAGLAFSGTDGQVLEGSDATGIAFTRQEPLGVVAQIVPWNYPIMMMAWKVAPALAAGCAIVFKPAELTPLATLLFCEMVRDAGYPAGAFNCVNSYGPVGGHALACHMDVDKIAFTGSTNVGKQIAVQGASSNLKKVGLELGGKSPNIVLPSANIEQTAAWCCLGIFENMGQSCTAASRILVHSSIYEQFLSAFIKKASSHKVGDPFDPETYSGPQISKAHVDRIDGYVKSGVSEGAKIVLGGNKVDKVKKFNSEGQWLEGGNFYEPTIFVDAQPWMKIVKEEIFGPVAIVMKFETVEEAIRMANDTEYGLAAGVHTEKQDEVVRVGAKLKAGTVWINSYAFCPANVPFGGYKSSGWGRELGKKGLEEYTITKSYQWNYAQKLSWPFDLDGISKL
ncbi:hypothetical protein PGT21_033091 [Puccinia graminis f. sp. tritici]|uniref:aldehyde dehydrogenase (NAD(+)) n=2 Tax=Puccinia graminis f. sp. tritici TaxID=56615 RepID=E3K575_PUCGT|nr:aldehyde dehydrogenase (NAD+) [Puccinia graminis f. sp. tritici CRL 75-36-700-3]EFP79671.2 aldehyde dehydrogenase (NAD+) [Puccinia graminis f. sp. tritici CRL 75-36-700-3]KAA1119744.1 hypothetical protein PGT21_033091 [Puccinia graminis f. sp. tritici]